MSAMTIKQRRLALDEKFRAIPRVHVYFQPPSSVQMTYPAIRYYLNDILAQHADDIPYIRSLRFTVIVIDKDPDSAVSEAISEFQGCRFSRSYSSDNLNHFVYEITI